MTLFTVHRVTKEQRDAAHTPAALIGAALPERYVAITDNDDKPRNTVTALLLRPKHELKLYIRDTFVSETMRHGHYCVAQDTWTLIRLL